MSGKTRSQRIQGYTNSPDCFFIGNKKSLIYHKKDCPRVEEIVNGDLIACGQNPENKGYKPCPYCTPTPIDVRRRKGDDPPISKAEMMRRAMSELAARRLMHIEFVGDNAFVTTIAGEWYFNYNIRPIQLHHKNLKVRLDRDGQSTGYFHQQKWVFETPLEVLAYIYQHERSSEDRAFAPQSPNAQ